MLTYKHHSHLRFFNFFALFICGTVTTGFNMSTGVPKVGVLQNAAWNLSDMCRFKLLPPPQPDRSVSDKDKRDLQVNYHQL